MRSGAALSPDTAKYAGTVFAVRTYLRTHVCLLHLCMTVTSRAISCIWLISPLVRMFCTLVATVASVNSWALDPEAIFVRASPAVWTVKSELGNNKFAVGSAVAIRPNLLVTACHVVITALAVTISQGKQEVKIIRITRDPDPERDLCVLEAEAGVKLATVAIAPIDTVRVGQKAYAIGSPHGLELTLTEGLVSALRPKAEGQLPIIQTSAAISSGSSGGGLFDVDARLMGVTDNISPGGENLGFAYPAQWVVELPQRTAAELAKWRDLLTSLGVVLALNGEPTASGHATLDDMTALPKIGEDPKPLQLAYQQFLLQARPRAFMITADGHFGTVTGSSALIAQLTNCADAKIACAVYAVDNTVVWGKQKAAVAGQ